jgi:hypothetical protein
MLEEESTRLTAAMNNKEFDDTGTAEVLVTATTQPKRLTVNQMSVRYRFCHFVAFIEFK